MRRPFPGLAGGGPDDPPGPAAATLHTVAMRTAALVRSIGIGYVLVQIVIWRTFFTAQPARLASPLIAVAALVPAAAGWQATMNIGDAGAGFLAVRWRKAA